MSPQYPLGARNPLIRRYFLGVFRFAQNGAGQRQNPTHANNNNKGSNRNKVIDKKAWQTDYRDCRDKSDQRAHQDVIAMSIKSRKNSRILAAIKSAMPD
jgi:hypothetical protein